jgi:DNA-directed RNA polymerase III subunit RPC1
MKFDSYLSNGLEKYIEDMNPLKVYNLFLKISEQDITLLNMSKGINHPLDLLLVNIVVPPNQIRPTVKERNDKSREDDLTASLMYIQEKNLDVKK